MATQQLYTFICCLCFITNSTRILWLSYIVRLNVIAEWVKSTRLWEEYIHLKKTTETVKNKTHVRVCVRLFTFGLIDVVDGF